MSTISRASDELVLERNAPRAAGPVDRLWPLLSRPLKREKPATGFDVAGEKLRALMVRRRVGRADRRRAQRIMQAAAALAGQDRHGWESAVESARAAVVRDRDNPAAIDAAFAVGYEAVRSELGLSLYLEQVMGALAMAQGCCAEMATGEGKTVTAVLPAALDAFSGWGVHVITVNDYLARRDAGITGAAFRRMGLSVGIIQDKTPQAERRIAYGCSITYGSDKQFIFDHLRDRLSSPLMPRMTGHLLDQLIGPGGAGVSGEEDKGDWGARIVQRGLHAALIDEADSILIDEAVTPAIIGMDPEGKDADGGRAIHYKLAAAIAQDLVRGEDYLVDERLRRVVMTDSGRARLAERVGQLPPFWTGPRRREELVVQALTAKEVYHLGDEYIIKDGQIVIVDRSTGRLLEGRQWQLGLHQAVEAKEGVEIAGDRQTTARTSYQQFFQRYRRLSGMTGTAWEVAGELWQYYRLPVVRVPTHKPIIRKKARDRVFVTEREKFQAVATRVAEFNDVRRPVLVGTRSVTASELLGALLAERGVSCRILNANREAEEAAIIAEAGKAGAVTVATNMAGRGTDILLDPEARKLGGLVVIATEHHDEARVDRQLYGRSGRQGDPGRAEAFVSLDESLITRHGLSILRLLCRAGRGPVRQVFAWMLWGLGQWSAGRRTASIRGEIVKHDAWLDMALHHHTR
jgi:preprotein translocase subunit SecA